MRIPDLGRGAGPGPHRRGAALADVRCHPLPGTPDLAAPGRLRQARRIRNICYVLLGWMQGVLEAFAQDVEREMLASAPRAPRTPSPLAAAALAAAERPGEHYPWENGFASGQVPATGSI